MKKLLALALTAALAACSSTLPAPVPYAELGSVTTAGGPLRSSGGTDVRGGWYPHRNLAEGGLPEHGGSNGNAGPGN